MFALGAATRVYVATGATDMRIGFDGRIAVRPAYAGGVYQVLEAYLCQGRSKNQARVAEQIVWSAAGTLVS